MSQWPSRKTYLVATTEYQPFKNPFELFENPFEIEDIAVFDNATLQRLLSSEGFKQSIADLAPSLQGTPPSVVDHVERNVPLEQLPSFKKSLIHVVSEEEVKVARKRLLHTIFWELIYWKMPKLYDELTDSEQLHPAIFQHLESDLRGNVVLDVGAGTGRATLQCIRHGAKLVYGVDPSPGLLCILEQKLRSADADRVVLRRGSFEQLPLENDSVDVSLSCAAFSSKLGCGGELGLAELWRVTKPNGKIVLVWPNPDDYDWLAKHGFQYVGFPVQQEAHVRFRSLESALRCVQHFYAGNKAASQYILEHQRPEVPFSILGFEQPHDYCWLAVKK